jgi:uncharacterized protein (DUF1697 family)
MRMAYVALLRGVNLGPHRRLAMADLRTWLGDLGYDGVRTHLQSGNAVFTSAKPAATVAREIERRIEAETGTAIPCLIRTHDELRKVIDADPFAGVATDPARYVVAFLSATPTKPRLSTLDPAAYEPERWHIGEREIYLWYPNGIHDSKLNRELTDRNLGVVATARNWNTVRKLADLSGQ